MFVEEEIPGSGPVANDASGRMRWLITDRSAPATAENGEIVISQIAPLTEKFTTILPRREWGSDAALVPLDRTMVKMRLCRSSDKQVEAVVDDLRVNAKDRTRFIQLRDTPEFTLAELKK